MKGIILILLSIPKTIYFNLKCLNFRDAIKLPVIVSFNTCLSNINGKIIIKNPKTFSIHIGFGDVDIFDKRKSRTIWSVKGKVIFEGTANIGHGSKVSVHKTGVLILGDNFSISAESAIVCSKSITFGANTLMSWDNLFMDTDFHNIYDNIGNKINKDLPITVGSDVWFGCRCTILKGSNIPNNSVIGASSLVTSSFVKSGTIIGGSPSKVLRENINWK